LFFIGGNDLNGPLTGRAVCVLARNLILAGKTGGRCARDGGEKERADDPER
jgi:hypothetical protein